MNREERDELIWLYAAGALGDAELQSVRALLEEGGAEDLASLSAARETLARLPEALDPASPPDAVLDRVLKRIGSSDAPVDKPGAAAPRRSIVPAVITALAACIAVVATWAAFNFRGEAQRARKQLDESLAALGTMRNQSAADLAQLRSEMEARKVATAKQLDELIAQNRLLYTENLRFTALERQNLPRGGGRVVWDVANRKAVVFVFDLAPPADGSVYQLWFIEQDKPPVPSDTFTVDASGKGQLVAAVPAGLENIQVAAITVEPAGGSKAPSSDPILVGNAR